MVESDDPVNPRLKLKISGKVLVDFDFAKTSLRFNGMRLGESRTQSVDILLKDPKSVKFGIPESNLSGLKVKVVEKKDKDGKLAYALELDYTPEKSGRLRGNVTLPVIGKKKKLSLNVSAKVQGDIVLKPERLNLWKDMPESVTNQVNVKSDKENFKILKAVDTSGRMNTKVSTVEKGRHYAIKVEPSDKGKKESRSFTSTIKITTNSKKQREMEFNVFYSPKSRKSSVRQGGIVQPPHKVDLKKLKKKSARKAAKKIAPGVKQK